MRILQAATASQAVIENDEQSVESASAGQGQPELDLHGSPAALLEASMARVKPATMPSNKNSSGATRTETPTAKPPVKPAEKPAARPAEAPAAPTAPVTPAAQPSAPISGSATYERKEIVAHESKSTSEKKCDGDVVENHKDVQIGFGFFSYKRDSSECRSVNHPDATGTHPPSNEKVPG